MYADISFFFLLFLLCRLVLLRSSTAVASSFFCGVLSQLVVLRCALDSKWFAVRSNFVVVVKSCCVRVTRPPSAGTSSQRPHPPGDAP